MCASYSGSLCWTISFTRMESESGPEPPRKTDKMTTQVPRHFIRTVLLVFLSIGILSVIDTFLAKLERAESQVEGTRLFEQAQRLMQRGSNGEAINRLKDALEVEHGNREYQKTLAQAQLADAQTADAHTTLTDLL